MMDFSETMKRHARFIAFDEARACSPDELADAAGKPQQVQPPVTPQWVRELVSRRTPPKPRRQTAARRRRIAWMRVQAHSADVRYARSVLGYEWQPPKFFDYSVESVDAALAAKVGGLGVNEPICMTRRAA